MQIKTAKFVASYPSVERCPKPTRPEFAFIGRSNVGKSSLINMLTGHGGLAKVSQRPGKTQTINYFDINGEWFLVDLPGYGYARVPQSTRKGFARMVEQFVLRRTALYSLFMLVDSRLAPQRIDLEFAQWMGEHGVPFAVVFTKADKMSRSALQQHQELFATAMLERWEALPPFFTTSATSRLGRDELLTHIAGIIEE
ncbi:MAG: YihA family ribosome biogenesis GTP-binding protein [Bacteroidales bacterium]|nr:YihA family ribosome biogenesis GTP-binding protein [Bacteroidales bacterium]